jgi:4-amino-4-deoxy-L-arabinose transferase-like glycosyltransferase
MRRAWTTPLVLVLVVAGAAVLRLTYLGQVAGNPFYDAAVHTMSQSWHAFLFGALDPSGGVSVDKPPVDLWLQVASVKVLGFTPTALKLPQALAGIASVALLFDVIRRVFGRGPGLAAAAALAVLPVAVLTARSDTMDTAMGFLVLLAAWFVVRALETRRVAWLLGAGVAVGLAFNVKLFQALLPLPALALLWLAGPPLTPPRRIAAATAAMLVAALVGFAWITPVALTPAAARPYPIGSTDGSIWNLVFVFNGVDRLHGRPVTTPDTLPPGSRVSAAIVRSQRQRTRRVSRAGRSDHLPHRPCARRARRD